MLKIPTKQQYWLVWALLHIKKHITQNEMLLCAGKGICTQALMEQLLQMPIAAGALLLLALLWVSQFEHYNNTKK